MIQLVNWSIEYQVWLFCYQVYKARLWEHMLNGLSSLALSTSVLKALSGKLDIKRHSPSILYITASLTLSTSILKALPGKLDIKRHSPSILYITASLTLSTSILKALPGKLDIKRHSPVFSISCSPFNTPFVMVVTGLPRSGKKFWKMKNFPSQGKVRELHFQSGKFKKNEKSHGKVRE